MDLATGRQPVPPRVEGQLKSVYHRLATKDENLPTLTGPADRGYSGPQTRDELVAEGIRASLAEPNFMKTDYPEAYDWVSDLLAKTPDLGVRANSVGATIAATLGAMGVRNESEASEVPVSEVRGPSIPSGQAGDATKAGAYGLSKVTNAISQRGLGFPRPRNEKFRGLVRALVDLEARKKTQLYGGPR